MGKAFVPAETVRYVGSGFVIFNLLSHWIWQIPIDDVWSSVNSF